MLTQFAKPGALVAVVSDSYDLWNACEHLWGEQLKQKVIDSGATVVIRPDSGNPPEGGAQDSPNFGQQVWKRSQRQQFQSSE